MSNLTFGYPLGSPGGQLGDSVDASPSLTTGAADANYPLVNIYNGNPALPFKCTGTTLRILWDFGSAKTIFRVAILNHNLDAALANVAFGTGATTATADFSEAFTIPAKDYDGYTVSPHVTMGAYAARRYGALSISTANSVNIIIGEICIQLDNRALTDNIGFQSNLVEVHGVTTQKTNLGVQFTYQRGDRVKSIRNAPISTTDWPTIQNWRRACRGNSKPHLLIPDTSVNEAWYGKWDMAGDTLSMNFGKQGPLVRDVQFNWTEVSRGLPWSDI